MTIDEIRDKLAENISQNHETWGDLLSDTNPGNYGSSYWEIELKPTDIFVDIPNRTYTFKNAQFSFTVRIGESGKDGVDMDFSKQAKGKGEFDFSNDGKDVVIKEMEIDVDLDLFD
tara:strand:+ start:275 stop:622 length:348 start_codon:yes stop_codon:yes gene_type:complete